MNCSLLLFSCFLHAKVVWSHNISYYRIGGQAHFTFILNKNNLVLMRFPREYNASSPCSKSCLRLLNCLHIFKQMSDTKKSVTLNCCKQMFSIPVCRLYYTYFPTALLFAWGSSATCRLCKCKCKCETRGQPTFEWVTVAPDEEVSRGLKKFQWLNLKTVLWFPCCNLYVFKESVCLQWTCCTSCQIWCPPWEKFWGEACPSTSTCSTEAPVLASWAEHSLSLPTKHWSPAMVGSSVSCAPSQTN